MRPGNTDASFLYLRGDHPYGSREYLWVQHAMDADTSSKFTTTETKESTTLLNLDGLPLHIIASLKAHRNIVFGATVGSTTYASRSDCSSILTDTCRPLLRAALDDCSKDGEQPQAVSALHGLSVYVRSCLQGERQSAVLDKLGLRNSNDSDNPSPVSTPTTSTSDAATLIEVAAVTAIATGVPRPGHSVVGQGTYRDGAVAWEALARDFIALKLCDECELYRSANAELVQIELLADTSPDYLASAGGAMARFFFL